MYTIGIREKIDLCFNCFFIARHSLARHCAINVSISLHQNRIYNFPFVQLFYFKIN